VAPCIEGSAILQGRISHERRRLELCQLSMSLKYQHFKQYDDDNDDDNDVRTFYKRHFHSFQAESLPCTYRCTLYLSQLCSPLLEELVLQEEEECMV
jgi:hypothetical protein